MLKQRSYTTDKLVSDSFILRNPDAYNEAVMYRRIFNLPMPLSAEEYLVKCLLYCETRFFLLEFSLLKNIVNLELFGEMVRERINDDISTWIKVEQLMTYSPCF